jgi:hypothetical protein
MAAPLPAIPGVYTTTGVKETGQLQLQAFVWTGATTAADTVVVKDGAGNTLWTAIASGAQTYLGLTFHGARGLECTGLNVTTIASGTLLVYFKDKLGPAL